MAATRAVVPLLTAMACVVWAIVASVLQATLAHRAVSTAVMTVVTNVEMTAADTVVAMSAVTIVTTVIADSF